MSIHPDAGKPAGPAQLVNIPRLITAYYSDRPDAEVPAQRVSFGTSGHRGSSLQRTFNEWHILAIAQGICIYRKHQGIDGPLFIGIDTHALSEPAFASAMEVLAANSVETMIAANRLNTIAAERPGWRMGSSSRHRTIHRRTVVLNTILRMAARRIVRPRLLYKRAPTNSWPASCRA
jgi:hypothetical protein